ncbi:MAG TPA: ATP-binding protein [Desulfobacterales bacterium]
MPEAYRETPISRRRFSTLLTAVIVVLSTVSVITILVVLGSHFNVGVEREYRKKLRAQKGQVEIRLQNRFADIQNRLRDLAEDNAVRVTMMLDAGPQLEERLLLNYSPESGAYFFVKKKGGHTLLPKSYPGLSQTVVASSLEELPRGATVKDGRRIRLLWLFAYPLIQPEGMMGTAYALYDLSEDLQLLQSIDQNNEGELAFRWKDHLTSLTTDATPPLSSAATRGIDSGLEPIVLDGNRIALKIAAVKPLYFLASLKPLSDEKQKISLVMAVVSGLILTVSIFISLVFGRRMVRPLQEMTRKAIQISEGVHPPRFEISGTYWEFDRLSQAFDTMLAQLREAEERSRYKELLENVDDSVYILDQQGRILDANAAAYTLLGYPPEAFFRLALSDILPDADAEKILQQLSEAGRNPGKLQLETEHYCCGGERIPVEIHSRPITYQGQSVILNVARDVRKRVEIEEEKRQLQEQLLQAQKMEAIGTLAGGVAHDFNNLLMGIQGRLSMMRMQVSDARALEKHVDRIEQTVMSAANLTRQLLGFARKGKYEVRPTCVKTLIDDTTRMFISTRKEIRLQLQLSDGLPRARIDRGQIEQVLINLYVNAWHAMPDGGDLIIKARETFLNAAFCRAYEVPEGRFVEVSVSDTGCGMDPKTMDRIFEPFFTTKGVGKGTGLGLASAYGIIKNHKGIIRVESRKGSGTTFTLYLPVFEGPESQASQNAAETDSGHSAPVSQPQETDLLLADEAVRRKQHNPR